MEKDSIMPTDNKLSPRQDFDYVPTTQNAYGWNSTQSTTSTTVKTKVTNSEITITIPARKKCVIVATAKLNLKSSADNKRVQVGYYKKEGAGADADWGYIAVTDSVRQLTSSLQKQGVVDNSGSDSTLVVKIGLWFMCIDSAMTATHEGNFEVDVLNWFI